MENSKKQAAESNTNNNKANRTEFANDMNTTNTNANTNKNSKNK